MNLPISEREVKMFSDIKRVYLDEIDSTNDYAKKLAQSEKSDILVIAEKQTAGKGRKGRTFISPEGGIYMSLLLHQNVISDPTKITVMASVAVARAIEKVLGINAQIKWVNDIYVNGKKVCGILTEGAYNSQKKSFDYAVLGIGINLSVPKNGFSEDIKDIAGALTDKSSRQLKEQMINSILDCFFDIYYGKKEYMSEYKSRSNVLGKQIEYIKNNEKFSGNAVDISESGELIVEENGEKKILNSGEIKICIESIKK